MIRLHVIAEGQTEEAFVNNLLVDHLGHKNIVTDVRCVETGRDRRRNVIYRGGMTNYSRAKGDILRWMAEDGQSDARFTTMFDLYGLPADFPGYEQSRQATTPLARVSSIEEAFLADMGSNAAHRFIPYIQLHEFEALLLADPSKFHIMFLDQQRNIDRLTGVVNGFQTPEDINEGETTAPSKRIIGIFPEYEGLKVTAGHRIAQEIGIEAIRGKCPHFDAWLSKLESLDA